MCLCDVLGRTVLVCGPRPEGGGGGGKGPRGGGRGGGGGGGCAGAPVAGETAWPRRPKRRRWLHRRQSERWRRRWRRQQRATAPTEATWGAGFMAEGGDAVLATWRWRRQRSGWGVGDSNGGETGVHMKNFVAIQTETCGP